MMLPLLLSLIGCLSLCTFLRAEDKHEHHYEDTDPHEHGPGGPHAEHDEEKEADAANVGPDFAVLEADPDQGFRLSEKAMKALGVELEPLSDALPLESVVRFKDESGVYRWREGWFKLVE